MKNCPKCGMVCDDNAKFCTLCGSPLTDPAGTPEEVFEANAQTSDATWGEETQDTYSEQYQEYQQTAYGQSMNGQAGAYGAQDTQGQQYTYGQGTYNQYGYGQPGYGQPQSGYGKQVPQVNIGGIQPRNIAVAIILSIVTCGIYSIYWMIKLNDEVNQMSGETGATSGGMVFLFSLITCGIYSYYWLYKMGERCDRIKGDPKGYSPLLYLVFGILGLGIVSYALMQDVINKCFPYSA